MGKTYEALRRAEEERRSRWGEPSPVNQEGRGDRIVRNLDEYRQMKYKLLHFRPPLGGQALLFCSCQSGEGSSTVLAHFAAALSAGGDRVLLVDANLKSPSLHLAFGLKREDGLVDLLQGTRELKELMKTAPGHPLRLITSGSSPSSHFSPFDAKVLDEKIRQMRAEAEWVLFDSPPVNTFSDSIPLAGRVDGVVLVVEAEKTRWQSAERAVERLKGGGGNVLGVVLNKRRFYLPRWLYQRL